VQCFWINVFIIFTKIKFCYGNGKVVCVYIIKAYGRVEVQLLILNLSSRSR